MPPKELKIFLSGVHGMGRLKPLGSLFANVAMQEIYMNIYIRTFKERITADTWSIRSMNMGKTHKDKMNQMYIDILGIN